MTFCHWSDVREATWSAGQRLSARLIAETSLNIAKELRHCFAERLGQDLQGPKGGILAPPLQIAKERTPQPGVLSEIVLPPKSLLPKRPHSLSHPCADVLACHILSIDVLFRLYFAY